MSQKTQLLSKNLGDFPGRFYRAKEHSVLNSLFETVVQRMRLVNNIINTHISILFSVSKLKGSISPVEDASKHVSLYCTLFIHTFFTIAIVLFSKRCLYKFFVYIHIFLTTCTKKYDGLLTSHNGYITFHRVRKIDPIETMQIQLSYRNDKKNPAPFPSGALCMRSDA